ncbi:MAG: RNA polymerase sigma factor [Flavobacteriaceae bacterium]|nr:RNA polymerase sigma factor [Flavobacteriaceae bacterium]
MNIINTQIFDEIYDKYKDLVFNLSLQYSQNVQDAEEITQDVFVKIYYKIDSFRNEATIKTWIYRITVNQSLDFIKHKKRKRRGFITSLLGNDKMNEDHLLPDFDHPGILMEQDESLKRLMQKIYQLKGNQKTVIILLKIEGLSQKKVAEIMKLSVKSVDSLFQRAKINLKKSL